MACFLAPAAEAVVATIATRVIKKKEDQAQAADSGEKLEQPERIPFSRKLKWLTNLLWGGTVLLAFEHVWHGEVVPWFPFLTAASDPGDAAEMLREISTVGVTMAVLVTVIWVVMLCVSKAIEKRPAAAQTETK
ncbi:MAG: hypothetical protein J5569_01335 [Oscillospiraceae bacterium]|nr:hypothetical protein [Oscillospiraceae bacterium]